MDGEAATDPTAPLLPGDGSLAIALIAIFVIWVIAKRLRLAEIILSRHRWGEALVDCIVAPTAVLAFGWILDQFMQLLGVSDARFLAYKITELLLHLAVGFCVARIVEVWIVTQRKAGGDRTLTGIGRSMLFGVCLLGSLVIWASSNDYGSPEVFLSTGALAALVAFAMQQTLGDLFSGIAMSVEKPFRIGDWLRFGDGTEGEVMDINWRATRLRGWDNTTYVVPNGQLARQSFTNLHGPTHQFAPWYLVKIAGEADPEQVVALLLQTARECPSVLKDPAPVARLMTAATTPYTYMVWVHFPNYPSMFAGREELYRGIHAALGAAGLQISADITEVRHRPADASG